MSDEYLEAYRRDAIMYKGHYESALARIVALKAEQAKLSEMLKAEYQRAEAAERERDALKAELAQARSERRREHDLRVKIAGDLEGILEAFRQSDYKRAAAEDERDRLREALGALMFEAKVYALHNYLEPLAQRMYDIAEAAHRY